MRPTSNGYLFSRYDALLRVARSRWRHLVTVFVTVTRLTWPSVGLIAYSNM
ncbi:hypothetical protein Hanom_Chr17g01561851 [Helianthus anomalus]